MISAFATAGLVAVFTTGALPPPGVPARAPDLAIHAAPSSREAALDVGARPEGDAPPPACLGELCQPRVSVPGHELKFARPSRTELAAVYLERANLEPFATVAWLLLASGLRFDYTPPEFGGPSQAPTRWGSVFVRVKFRVDADNVPVIPRRHR